MGEVVMAAMISGTAALAVGVLGTWVKMRPNGVSRKTPAPCNLHSAIEARFTEGERRFASIENCMSRHGEMLASIDRNVAVLASQADRKR